MKNRILLLGHRLAYLLLAVLVVYIGSFACFRLSALDMALALPEDPHSRIVLFTRNSTVHGILRIAYAPLVTLFPGDCYYPSTAEHEKLILDIQPKDGKRIVPLEDGTRTE